MSNCPHCGSPERHGGRSKTWEILELQHKLKQANAVSDVIATLIGNGTTSISIHKVTVQGGEIAVNIDDNNTGPFSTTVHRDTLREALEACVKARDEFDKEEGK